MTKIGLIIGLALMAVGIVGTLIVNRRNKQTTGIEV